MHKGVIYTAGLTLGLFTLSMLMLESNQILTRGMIFKELLNLSLIEAASYGVYVTLFNDLSHFVAWFNGSDRYIQRDGQWAYF